MKNILRTTLFFSALLIFSMNLHAQSLEIISVVDVVKGTTDDILHTYANVKNISSSTVAVTVKMEMVELFPDHSLSICIGTCYPPQISDYVTPSSFILDPGEVSDDFDFYAVYYSYYDDWELKSEGFSRIKFTLFNEANPDDKVEYICEFTIDNTLDVNVADGEPAIAVYPNPATEVLNIDFSGMELAGNFGLEIYDMLGNIVYSENVSDGSKVSVNLSGFTAGNYMVRILENGTTKTVKPLSIIR